MLTVLSLCVSITDNFRKSCTVLMPTEESFLWKAPSLPIFSSLQTSSSNLGGWCFLYTKKNKFESINQYQQIYLYVMLIVSEGFFIFLYIIGLSKNYYYKLSHIFTFLFSIYVQCLHFLGQFSCGPKER